jgi:hypothetical protein
MGNANLKEEALKRTIKEALAETIHEQRELLHDVFAEVLEDFALTEAIREGHSRVGLSNVRQKE